MGLYECVVYEKSRYGEPHPVMLDGKPVSAELVSACAGKARYKYWRLVKEYWDVEIADIRVRSLNKRKQPALPDGWQDRLETANAIIRVMAKYGRHFLSENSDRRELVADPFIAHFRLDAQNELWFVDRYSRKPVLVRHSDWPGFSDGGTLRSIVQHLAAFITETQPIRIGWFSPSPDWMCHGDVWGYGPDMVRVRDEVAAILEGCK